MQKIGKVVNNEIIEGKKFLITGGTGSFGKTMVKYLLQNGVGEVRVLSRDEAKQDAMRHNVNDERLKFFIGDVRNIDDIDKAMYGVDYVCSAAALKQVPSCDFFPIQAVKTNIIGTENVLQSCIKNSIKKCVVLSTDKAVYPINAMGMTKALAEKVTIAYSRNLSNRNNYPVFCATRYGNVMASRGSVIPLFCEQIKKGLPLTITNPNMTRFLMSLEESVELVLYAFKNCNEGDIFVQKASASTVLNLAKALLKIFKADNPIEIIGIRHGEKNYEVLVGKEEMLRATDEGNFYKVSADMRNIQYDDKVDKKTTEIKRFDKEFNSDNTKQLEDIDEIVEKLYSSKTVRELLP